MRDRLRIAITADPELPVPPEHYGGIERVVHFLVERLTEAGHDVVLFAHRQSSVSCELVPYPGISSGSLRDTVRNAAIVAGRVFGGHFDVVHSFARLQYLAPLAWHPVRKLMSYQRPITQGSIARAVRLFGDAIEFTACSDWMTKGVRPLAPWHVVYNGVPLEKYAFRPVVAADAPVVFLGRIEHIKGPHLAIEAARRAGRRIVLAGNIQPEHQRYFDEQIQPHLDSDSVTFIGQINDRRKNELLGSAAALLMPILWDEPFGIVMAEALACGTPVVALARGAVPEVVQDGITGYVTTDVEGLAYGIERAHRLDRTECRRAAENRFGDAVIASRFEEVYRSLLHADGREGANASAP